MLRISRLVLCLFMSCCACQFALAASGPNVVLRWNNAALQGVRDSKIGPPMVSRALAIVHTCMFDAWAAYDSRAVGTELGGRLRQPRVKRTAANKQAAISYAAYRAVVDLFPGDQPTVFDPLMQDLGLDPANASTDTSTPAGIGNVACKAVLDDRHKDGSNQLGDMTASGVPYADWTGYAAVNPPSAVPVNPSSVVDPNRWQPLIYLDPTGITVTQTFLGAQWFKVKPFAMSSPDQFRKLAGRFGPALYGSRTYRAQALQLIHISANLTDKQKMIAEYWKDGPHSETPPGHWNLFGQFISDRDHHSMDDDVKMFFALNNAIFDASIVSWDAKRGFDSVRPATAIPFLFHGTTIRAWGGPGQGTVEMDGSDWIPYQPLTFPTPPFPEYISGHSTYSAAGAQILRLWTRSDRFGASVTFDPGTSGVEPGVSPLEPVTLSWSTFSQAADEAGISRRYGGIHFEPADLTGRMLGRTVATQAWRKSVAYMWGNASRGRR